MAFKLDPKCEVGSEIARVIREQLAIAIEMVARKSEPVRERIHLARTSCKKARAALKLVRSQDRKFYRRENRWLSDSARKLSRLRDADTMVHSFTALLEHRARAGQRRKFEPVHRALLAHRRASMPPRADLERQLACFVERLRKADKRLANWVPAGDFAAVAADFRRTYKRARAGLFAAQALETSGAFHAWRKATKAHAYQCRLLRAAWPPAMKELREGLKELAQQLGGEHDLTVLRQQLCKLRRKGALEVDGETFRAALGLIESRREELRAETIPLGERLFADRPRAIAERMRQWWRVAQEQPEAMNTAFV